MRLIRQVTTGHSGWQINTIEDERRSGRGAAVGSKASRRATIVSYVAAVTVNGSQ